MPNHHRENLFNNESHTQWKPKQATLPPTRLELYCYYCRAWRTIFHVCQERKRR